MHTHQEEGAERRALVLLAWIPALASSLAVAAGISLLYFAAVAEHRRQLVGLAETEALMMGAVARFDAEHSESDHPLGARAATLSQLAAAQQARAQSGSTRLVLGEKRAEGVHVLLDGHGAGSVEPVRAEALSRALAGEIGVFEGRDHRGVHVLAAFRPVPELQAALVAQVDLDELRAPYLQASVLSLALVLLVIGLGAWLTFRVGRPLIQRLDQVRLRYDRLVEMMAAGVEIVREDGSKLYAARDELDEAQRRLVQKERLAAMGELTGIVAHELRNPLGALALNLNALELRTKGVDNLERVFARCQRSIGRCDQLVQDLLDFARPKDLELDYIQIVPWVTNVLEEIAWPSELDVDLQLTAGDLRLEADSEKLRRAVLNVVSNAIQAMEQPPSEAEPDKTQERRLAVRCAQSGSYLVLEVEDTGPGITAEELSLVRQPLFSTKPFGTGLGLPTVERIVQAHGGELEIESELGEGTTVRLRLPLKPESAVA